MKNAVIIKKMDYEESKLSPSDRDFRPKYAYLFVKCAILYYNGIDRFFMANPIKLSRCLSRKALKSFAFQVVNGMGGVSSNNPIQLSCLHDAFKILEVFHFLIVDIGILKGTSLMCIKAEHFLDHETVELYVSIQ